MKNFRLSGLLLAALVSACAGTPTEAERTVEQILADKNLVVVEELDRLNASNVNGWEYVNDYNVILQTGASRRFLVEFRSRCPESQWNWLVTYPADEAGNSAQGRLMSGGRIGNCTMQRLYRLEKIEG